MFVKVMKVEEGFEFLHVPREWESIAQVAYILFNVEDLVEVTGYDVATIAV